MAPKPQTPPSGTSGFVSDGDGYPTWSPERCLELVHAADDLSATFWAEFPAEAVDRRLRVLYDLITER